MKKPAPNQPAVPPRRGMALSPQAQINGLAGQIQDLATRLEALRQQGAGNTREFKALEQLLQDVQDRLMMAEAKIKGR